MKKEKRTKVNLHLVLDAGGKSDKRGRKGI